MVVSFDKVFGKQEHQARLDFLDMGKVLKDGQRQHFQLFQVRVFTALGGLVIHGGRLVILQDDDVRDTPPPDLLVEEPAGLEVGRQTEFVLAQLLPVHGFESVERRLDRKSTRLNSSHSQQSRMPSSA